MKRFQTSKYRNAAPKIPKKEVNVKDFVMFPFKTTIFPLYISWPKFLVSADFVVRLVFSGLLCKEKTDNPAIT